MNAMSLKFICESRQVSKFFWQYSVPLSASTAAQFSSDLPLLLNNDVLWFSKGKALESFVELKVQGVDFFKQSKSKAAADHLCIMQDGE